MELGNRIKKYRNELEISQEKLAEKIYVSRQSISNWEKMKKEINGEDRKDFNKLGKILTLMFGLLALTPMPLLYFLDKIGIIIWVIVALASTYVALLVEKKKKEFDIQTYKEILAFAEGKSLDEISKAREEGKRVYQKILQALCAGIFSAILSFGIMYLLTN